MSKFKIKVIAHSLKYNQIARFGDIVDETQLTTNAADLIQQGFIERYFEESEETEEKPLSKMSEKELLDYAKDNDLKVEGLKKKSDILKAIQSQIEELNK